MRKILSLAAAVASVFAIGAAQAGVILIDDFNSPTPAQKAFDPTGGDATPGLAGPLAITGNPLPLLATTRTLSNLIATAGVDNSVTGANGTLSSIVAGGSPNFPLNTLNINNGTGIDSNNKVIWTINAPPPGSLSGPVSLFFQVLFSNVGIPGANNFFSFDINGTPISTVASVGNVSNVGLTFALSAADVALFAAPGTKTLTMSITGDAGYDLTLDSFGLQVPEPTSLALVGLALFGVGVVVSRRKA
jgi:hypothetical protein